MQVSVSFFKRAKSIEETIVNIEKTDCDFLHVDIGDGIFIPTDTKDIVSFVRESSNVC